MKTPKSKQEVRLEKKKKRTAALVQIIQLNDRDGRKKTPANSGSDTDAKQSMDGADDCIEKLDPTTIEPMQKRIKIENNQEDGAVIKQMDENSIISDKEYNEMKKTVNERKKSTSRYKPEIRLNLFGDSAQLEIPPNERTPIFLTDIQHLIMSSVFGSELSHCSPRWCAFEKRNQVTQTVVLVIEGLSLYQYTSNESLFKETSKIFDIKLEIVMPPYRDGQIIDEIADVALTDANRQNLIAKYGSIEVAINATQDQQSLMKTVFPVNGVNDNVQSSSSDDIFIENEVISRKQLLLSALQMVDEGYPLPLQGELANRYKNFILTKDSYEPITSKSPMIGLDCEMCRTAVGMNELTRISIVDEHFNSLYETLVRPKNKIVDYLTQFSGITSEMMINVTKTLDEVQMDVRRILPSDAILVGQSLQSDLLAMRMMHPYIIDTSIIYNLSGQRRIKSKLQTLTYEFLQEKIQDNPLGHDSQEDCVASLKLAKLKLSKGLLFGDQVLKDRQKNGINNGINNTSTTESNQKKRDTSTAFILSADCNIDRTKFDTKNLATTTPPITVHHAENNKSTIRLTQDLSINTALTISCVRMESHRFEEGKREKTISKIDRWISNIWDKVAPKGVFVVVMGGVPGSSSGVALLKIKKPS